MTKIDDILAAKAAYDEAVQSVTLDEVKPLFQGLFDEFPELTVVGWVQYTPYFNDGDPCVFSVGPVLYRTTESEDLTDEDGEYEGYTEEEALIASLPSEEGWEYDYGLYEWVEVDGEQEYRLKADAPRLPLAIKALTKRLGSMQDVMKNVFGEHSVVVVTRDNIIVEEYHHD